MKKFILSMAFLVAAFAVYAQPSPTELDKSPMDMAYYPPNYPIVKMRGQGNGGPLARLIYSRPQKKDRQLFGEEIKYNEAWRLGANESTELELFKNGTIGGKNIPK